MNAERLPLNPEFSAEAIEAAFAAAQKTLYGLTADPGFHAACTQRGIEPFNDMGQAPYWRTLADYAAAGVQRARLNPNADQLRLSAFELVSAAPAAIYDQAYLRTHPSSSGHHNMAQRTSRYYSQLRGFAQEFPNTTVSGMTTGLLHIANMAIESPSIRRASPQLLGEWIRGAQHELAFGQILAHTGRSFTPATFEQDQKGIDYIVTGDNGKRIGIDVKASLQEVEQMGAAISAYRRQSDEKIIMYSLTKDAEFSDRFCISDAAAALKAPVLNQLISDISNAQTGYRTA